MRKFSWLRIVLVFAGLALLAALVYQLPAVQQRLGWRVDFAMAYVRGVISPVGELPTPLPPPAVKVTARPSPTPTASPTPEATSSPTPGATPTPTLTPTPIPAAISLTPPKWEKQDANACGPTTLALGLRYWGWEGDQFTISELLKPKREDRNVNVEELIYYTRTRAGWLHAEYRVGGDLETLKRLIAAGIPVIVEEAFLLETTYWPNDDRWAAHYNLLTGYDDVAGVFTGQDTYIGADQRLPYARLDRDWQAFNRVYILVYPPEKEELVKSILGPNWDVDYNRQQALQTAQAEAETDPQNAFTWFNQGTNLVYFERYGEAAAAFDRARQIGLPQRMLRYQFTPFFAYFHSRRMEDLQALVDYSLRITKNSEEALLWRGWYKYREGDTLGAVEDFRQALLENPNYEDAKLAIAFVTNRQ